MAHPVWTEQEKARLLELHAAEATFVQMAAEIGRTKDACKLKLYKLLGKITDEYVPCKPRANRRLTEMQIARIRKLLETYTLCDTARIVGCTPNTIIRLRRKNWNNHQGHELRPRPNDFALYAHDMTSRELMEHYKTSQGCIKRWSDEIGGRKYEWKSKRPKRLKRPADFHLLWPKMRSKDLCAHYGVNKEVITRWRDECGFEAKYPESRLRKTRGNKPKPGWIELYMAERRAA